MNNIIFGAKIIRFGISLEREAFRVTLAVTKVDSLLRVTSLFAVLCLHRDVDCLCLYSDAFICVFMFALPALFSCLRCAAPLFGSLLENQECGMSLENSQEEISSSRFNAQGGHYRKSFVRCTAHTESAYRSMTGLHSNTISPFPEVIVRFDSWFLRRYWEAMWRSLLIFADF